MRAWLPGVGCVCGLFAFGGRNPGKWGTSSDREDPILEPGISEASCAGLAIICGHRGWRARV